MTTMGMNGQTWEICQQVSYAYNNSVFSLTSLPSHVLHKHQQSAVCCGWLPTPRIQCLPAHSCSETPLLGCTLPLAMWLTTSVFVDPAATKNLHYKDMVLGIENLEIKCNDKWKTRILFASLRCINLSLKTCWETCGWVKYIACMNTEDIRVTYLIYTLVIWVLWPSHIGVSRTATRWQEITQCR